MHDETDKPFFEPAVETAEERIAARETWKAKQRRTLVKRGKAIADLMAEHAVLDLSSVVTPAQIATVAVWLHPEAFTSPARSRLWAGVCRIAAAGEEVDLLSAAGHDDLARQEACAILALGQHWIPLRFEGFAADVAKWAAVREVATHAANAADTEGCTPDEAMARYAALNATLPATDQEAAAQAVITSHEMALGLVSDYYGHNDEANRVSYTLPELDAATEGGMHADRPTILGAHTGVGKTAMAIQIACAAARNVPTYVLNAESTRRVWQARAASHLWNIPLGDILAKRLHDPSDLNEAAEALDGLALYLDDGRIKDGRPNLDVNAFCERALVQHRKTPLGLVLVDYITKLTIREKYERPDLKYAAISDRLAALCKQLGCPVLVLSQLTETQPGVAPTRFNVAECRKIANDAGTVVLLWCPNPQVPQEVEFVIDKAGLSARGTVPALFLGAVQRFESREWKPSTHENVGKGRKRYPTGGMR